MNRFPGVDFMEFDSLLTEEERLIRGTVRSFIDDKVKPIIEECHREARPPIELAIVRLGPRSSSPSKSVS